MNQPERFYEGGTHYYVLVEPNTYYGMPSFGCKCKIFQDYPNYEILLKLDGIDVDVAKDLCWMLNKARTERLKEIEKE